MKTSTSTPITTICTATRRSTTHHLDPKGNCIATTSSHTTVDLGIDTTSLSPVQAQEAALSQLIKALDLLCQS